MTKIVCDKCGKEFRNNPFLPVKFPAIEIYYRISLIEPLKELDLCDNCKKQVREFIFGEKPEDK